MEEWRVFLYPFGFLSSLAFGARFIIQWLRSEQAGASVTTRSFWQLSLIGNILLIIHGFVQVQYHVCLIQVSNALFSWRNLNLMQTRPSSLSTRTVVLILLAALITTSAAFGIQHWLIPTPQSWFRIPQAPWQMQAPSSVPPIWHFWGALAYLIFCSRFWVQWWLAERWQASLFTASFWWLSLIGALMSLLYFMRIGDSVNLIGPLLGLIPYTRNLMLYRTHRSVI